MTRVLAVDGGQSGIRLKSTEQAGTVEVEGVSRLEGETMRMVASAVESAWQQGHFAPVDRVVLGLTTSPPTPAAAEELAALVAAIAGASEVWIANDTVTAHAGALSAEPGVALIAGTGIACLAVKETGDARSVDGDGYLLGDAGGGFWIGSRGIAAVLKQHDGRGEVTALTDRASEAFEGIEDLAARLHSEPRPVNRISQFARDVLAAASDGDPVARAIIDSAARELFATAQVAMNWIGPTAPLALGGKLLGPNTPLFARIVELLAVEGSSFRPADSTPLDGGLIIGTEVTPDLYRSLIHVWQEGTLL